MPTTIAPGGPDRRHLRGHSASLFAALLLLGLVTAPAASAAAAPPATNASGDGHSAHRHTSPDGQLSVICTCRPATSEEAGDLSLSPEGWVQEGPRESYSNGEVPLPLVPDWTGTRNRAVGGLAWGDADHDGDLDLAVGTYYANSYPPIPDYYNFIYLNHDGTLEADPSWISPDEKHTTDLFWAPINGDSYPDLIDPNPAYTLQPSQVFYGQDGLLPLTAGWISNDACWSIDSAPCDFDDDGDLDVATANQGTTNDPYRPTYLFLNEGNGLNPYPWWASSQIGITNGVDWADMNDDSRPDLAVSGWSSWQSGVFLNVGTTLETTFAWTSGHPERTSKGVGWSDVDGDTRPDLAIGGNGDPDEIYRNDGTILGDTPWWQSNESFTGCQELVWVDIDNDQDEDLALIHFSTGHVRIYLNDNGALPTVADWQYDASSSGNSIAFGDLNGDGGLDLAVGVANGPVMVFLNTGDPTGVRETAQDLPRTGQFALRAAPNPFLDRLNLSIEGPVPGGVTSATILDVTGRRVADLSPWAAGAGVPRRTHRLSWSPEPGLPVGIYFVRAAGRSFDGREWSASTTVIKVGQ